MYERDINQRSYVAGFRHNGNRYEHNIFIADDDRVECIDQDGKVILTFTADCYVLTGHKDDKDRQQLGTLHMWGSEGWFFRPEGEPDRKVSLNVQDILKGEVTIAKMYLDGEFLIKPKAKEGA